MRVSRDGRSVFITDEYGPYVYQFDRSTGQRIRVFSLPAKFAVTSQNGVGNTEISGNASGRVAKKGMEGLAITPDGRSLAGIMQSPLLQDGGTVSGTTTRSSGNPAGRIMTGMTSTATGTSKNDRGRRR